MKIRVNKGGAMQNIDKLGRDELFYLIADKKEEGAMKLLETISNVNFQDKNDYSYLHIAVQVHSIDIVKKLIEKGAAIDIKDKFGKTPLMVAISHYNGSDEIIKLLIQKGADIEQETNSGVSCLKFAKMKGVTL